MKGSRKGNIEAGNNPCRRCSAAPSRSLLQLKNFQLLGVCEQLSLSFQLSLELKELSALFQLPWLHSSYIHPREAYHPVGRNKKVWSLCPTCHNFGKPHLIFKFSWGQLRTSLRLYHSPTSPSQFSFFPSLCWVEIPRALSNKFVPVSTSVFFV